MDCLEFKNTLIDIGHKKKELKNCLKELYKHCLKCENCNKWFNDQINQALVDPEIMRKALAEENRMR